MPEPTFSGNGNHVHVSVNANSIVNPNSTQFAAASNACKRLLANGGVGKGNAITAVDQAEHAQYKNALTTCEKLIPSGLPYSTPGTS
jgi:hypothetical protein